MQQKGIKAVTLAREAALSEAIVSEYLSGKKEPRGKQSIAIAKALGVSLDELWETGFQAAAQPGPTPREQLHLEKYRRLPSQGQASVDQMIDTLLSLEKYRRLPSQGQASVDQMIDTLLSLEPIPQPSLSNQQKAEVWEYLQSLAEQDKNAGQAVAFGGQNAKLPTSFSLEDMVDFLQQQTKK